MNDIQCISPTRENYGTTLGTNIRSFITFGRRTSSTGNVKAGLYNLNISTSSVTAASSATANLSTQFGNNCSVQGSTYVDDDLIGIVVARGAAGRDLLRVTTTGGTISSTRTSLTTSTSKFTSGDIVSTRDAYGSSQKNVFSVWTENNNGSGNRYVKIACHELSSGISQVGSTFTVSDSSNTFKVSRIALLKNAGASNLTSEFLVATSDVNGDLRLQIVGSGS